MCGIVGYVGHRSAVEVILSGLRRLEYRGYDSAGIAVIRDGALACVKSEGKLAALSGRIEQLPKDCRIGIGHTRWATHGAPNEMNAHPHLDAPGKIAVVHNGIIENFAELRASIEAEGVVFRSETDTETLAHLIRRHYRGDLVAAVRAALKEVSGAYALGVVCADHPGLIVAARQGSPLILGLGEGEAFIASDVPAIMKYTRNVVYIEDGQVCAVRCEGSEITDLMGTRQAMKVSVVDWDDEAAEKGGYPHFMLKEIHEQPRAILNTLSSRARRGSEIGRAHV